MIFILVSEKTRRVCGQATMPRTHIIFQEGTPRRTDISLIGLGGRFRYFLIF